MFGNKKDKKTPKGRRGYYNGLLSFHPSELLDKVNEGGPNAQAYQYLYDSINTTSDVREKKYKKGDLAIDDVYPITAEETEEMRVLLAKAREAVQDTGDTFFYACHNELEGVAVWSGERHWNFQWTLILGVLIMVCFLFYKTADKKSDVMRDKARLEAIKDWKKSDSVTTRVIDGDTLVLNHAEVYRYSSIEEMESKSQQAADYLVELNKSLDTASTKESKAKIKEMIKKCEDVIELSEKEIEDLQDMSFKQIKKKVRKAAAGELSASRSAHRFVLLWNLFFLFLIPVYIFAERPYGYNISRYRAEAETLGGIKKMAYGLAAFLSGTALAMNFLPDTIYKWSDGRTTRESDPMNMIIMAIKIGLLIAAVVVITVVSCFIVLYSTIQGLRRNYDWAPIIAKVKTAIKEKRNPVA